MSEPCSNWSGIDTTCDCNFCETGRFHLKVKQRSAERSYKVKDRVRWKLLPHTSRYEGEVLRILGSSYVVRLFYSGVELLFRAGELDPIEDGVKNATQ
jgi:hypothetical protein